MSQVLDKCPSSPGSEMVKNPMNLGLALGDKSKILPGEVLVQEMSFLCLEKPEVLRDHPSGISLMNALSGKKSEKEDDLNIKIKKLEKVNSLDNIYLKWGESWISFLKKKK